MVVPQVIAARVAAVVSKHKFIPAQGIAPQSFVTNGALADTAVAGTLVKAHNIVAFIFIAGCIADNNEGSDGYKSRNQNKA